MAQRGRPRGRPKVRQRLVWDNGVPHIEVDDPDLEEYIQQLEELANGRVTSR
jgi:hypothetical protein